MTETITTDKISILIRAKMMKPTSICLPKIICGVTCLKILKKKKYIYYSK